MREAQRFPRGCVASPHYLASSAGLAVLASGGNAIDAALATNLTLGVVQPSLCGYGGDLFAMVWDGDALHAYESSGAAPGEATVEAVRERAGSSEMPPFGPLTVTVPGAVDGWFALHERFATKPFDELARPALGYARDGFPLTARGASLFEAFRRVCTQQEWGRAWLETYGEAAAGRVLVQPGLARTIETLCERGPEGFYRGPIASAIAGTLREHGALMSVEDLAAHRGGWVEPLRATFRGVEVLEMPPPTQGVTALEALRITDGFTELGSGPDREHLLIEATKLALADRDAFVTDPAHMRVDPSSLFSDEWIAERRARIDSGRALAPEPGRAAVGGTVYLCAADASGMCVSLIQSNFRGFGSGVQVPGWGINLQNRGAFFALDPDHVNAIAPGKRTMHTLIPAMAFRDGRPWLVFGTMGGDGQAQTHLQLLVRMLVDGDDPQQAIDAPRWVISPAGWDVSAETRFARELLENLRSRGHTVQATRDHDIAMGHAHAIEVADDHYLVGTDPRAEGAALGR